MGTKIEKKPRVSGFCNPTLPRTTLYDPHQRCRGCDCTADNCPCNPTDAELCDDCGEPAVLVGYLGMWCTDCTPADVLRDVEDERAYESWKDDT